MQGQFSTRNAELREKSPGLSSHTWVETCLSVLSREVLEHIGLPGGGEVPPGQEAGRRNFPAWECISQESNTRRDLACAIFDVVTLALANKVLWISGAPCFIHQINHFFSHWEEWVSKGLERGNPSVFSVPPFLGGREKFLLCMACEGEEVRKPYLMQDISEIIISYIIRADRI